MTEQEFTAGHVFFRPGDPGDRAYLLHAGQVEVLAGVAEPYTRVGVVGPGEVFGEMALIEERPRSLTVRAVTAGRASPMTRDEFENLLTTDPARTRQYLRSLFERLRSVTARLDELELDRAVPLVPTAVTVVKPGTLAPAELPTAPDAKAGWVVVVHPLTRKAAETLPDEGLRITQFPLRIGRAASAKEREALDLNDLWLLDNQPYNVSRNHCEIYLDHEGPAVRDRGSHLGCGVNETRIGGRTAMGHARLEPGDNVLVVGSRSSPYQFRVSVTRA